MSDPVRKFVVETVLFLVGLIVTIGLPWLVMRALRSGRPSTTPRPITDDGAGGKVIPVIATFSGLRGLPWVGFASNSLNPRLVITADGVTYRVMARRTRRWSEVEAIDVRSFGATVNLGFVFRGTPVTLDANVGSMVLAAQILALVPDHVALTDRARSLPADPR